MISTGAFSVESVLGKALQVKSLRNEVILNNIANADTPRFKKSEVRFEDTLKNALETSGIKDIDVSKVNPDILVVDDVYAMRLDKNNVDLDAENVQLYVNAVRTDALANSVMANFKMLNMAIMNR
jgi:flagellar basal-body rod protein FlgB